MRGETTISLRESGPKVTKLSLVVEGLIPDLKEEEFTKIVEETAGGCPLVQLLKPGLEELEITSSLV